MNFESVQYSDPGLSPVTPAVSTFRVSYELSAVPAALMVAPYAPRSTGGE